MLTAGSARGVAEGLDDLLARGPRTDEFARRVIMAGGGLLPEHVPWLARAGVRAFQIGSAARPLGSAKAYVDADLVRTWRTLIDDAIQRSPTPRPLSVTVYIDPPTWPGHGRLWSHLISDTSYAELHEFAAGDRAAPAGLRPGPLRRHGRAVRRGARGGCAAGDAPGRSSSGCTQAASVGARSPG